MSYFINYYGKDKLEIVEDAVQDALVKAMKTWPFSGVPHEPSAWIFTVAKNKIIDHLRKESRRASKAGIIKEEGEPALPVDPHMAEELDDDMLRTMFACCHPTISVESQIILVLKILAGFGNAEIARALMKSEDAVAKSYTRAKKSLKEKDITLQVPSGVSLGHRLNSVLKIIYLIFNEGYNALRSDELINKDLCYEAIRLNKLITDSNSFANKQAHALMALLCFQASRFDSRLDAHGKLLTLERQDRNQWDKGLINVANYHMALASSASAISEYHLQAAIAANHAMAETFELTQWDRILELYDALLKIKDNINVSLNRIVAYAYVHGPDEGLKLWARLDEEQLRSSYLYYSIGAYLYEKNNRPQSAIEAYKRAKELTKNKVEIEYLQGKIDQLSVS